MRMEELDQLKTVQLSHRELNLHLPTCSIVPQPTALPRAIDMGEDVR
jgi:hypothetical protein